MTTAWTFDPALDDRAAEIAWQLRELTPESSTFYKLTALSNLVPTLARMPNMEVAALLEDLRGRIKLRACDLAELKAGVKAARKSLGKNSKQDAPPPDLADLEEVRRCHPAIDFLGGPIPEAMTLGFRVPLRDGKEGLLLVLSDGQGVRAEVCPETIKVGDVDHLIIGGCPPLLEDVWSLGELKSFIERPTRPAGLYQDLVAASKTFLDLQDPAAYGFMATWTLATYFTQIFAAVPFIHFFGPKETGKSKALEAFRFSCFNAYKGRDITAAALGDTVDGMRGVVLIDQAERLGMVNKAGESVVNLLGLLADSYKKPGGRRRVVEMVAGGRRVLEFSTYGFKGFASTKPLDPDLADRCIPISMTKTAKRLPDLEGNEPVWATLRDKCYRFALGAFQKVAAAYQATTGDGTRITELWRPLAAVLTALEVPEGEFEAVKKFFMAKAEEARHVPDGWELSLLEALEGRALLSPEEFQMTPGDLIEVMQVESKEKPGVKWVGEILSKYVLFVKKRRTTRDGKKVTIYTFHRSRVLRIIDIFLRGTSQEDENIYDSNEFKETGENAGASPEDRTRGQTWTCPPEMACPSYDTETIKESDGGQRGHTKSGGIPEKNFSCFSGDEVDPLGGEL